MKSAILLAAGAGKRAWPFCGVRQKTTVPVLHTPLVRGLAEGLFDAGVAHITVVTGERGSAVRAALSGLDAVSFVTQPTRDGPVDAALHALDHADGEDVLVCCADIATTSAAPRALLDALDGGARAAVLAAPPPTDPRHYTCVGENAGALTGVWAHPGGAERRFAGMAAAPAALLKKYLERNPGIMENAGVGGMPPAEGDLAYSFDLMRRDGIEVVVTDTPDYFVDVDYPWDMAEANRRAADYFFDRLESTYLAPGASVDDGADIPSGVHLWLERGAQIGNGCHLDGPAFVGENAAVTRGALLGERVCVGAGTRVEEYAKVGRHSVVGPRNILGHCAEFNGVSFDVVYLYHYSSVTGLVGSHVDIAAAVVCGTWRFDNSIRAHEVRGHKITPAAHGALTYIGDHVRTGVGAMFMPGVKVGSYVCVGPGVVVREDVTERTLVLVQQELETRPWGPERYGW